MIIKCGIISSFLETADISVEAPAVERFRDYRFTHRDMGILNLLKLSLNLFLWALKGVSWAHKRAPMAHLGVL